MNIDSKPIAMAYVPWQKWKDVVDPCKGLKQATIFNELVLPFIGSAAACNSQWNNHNNNINRGRGCGCR